MSEKIENKDNDKIELFNSDGEKKWNELFKEVFEKETTVFGKFFKVAISVLRTTTIWIITLSILGCIADVALRVTAEFTNIEGLKKVTFGFNGAFFALILLWLCSIAYIIFSLVCQHETQQTYLKSNDWSTPDAPILFKEDEDFFRERAEKGKKKK